MDFYPYDHQPEPVYACNECLVSWAIDDVLLTIDDQARCPNTSCQHEVVEPILCDPQD